MKVLLLEDVEKLGSAGDIKEVSGGYGRNYLIPKKLAVFATPSLIKQAEEQLAKRRKLEDRQRDELRDFADRINGTTLRFEVRVGEQDRLYGSVTSADIAERLAQTIGEEVDRRKVELSEPIKRTGLYSIAIRLMAGLEPRVNVVVEGENSEGVVEAVETPDPLLTEAGEPALDATDEADSPPVA